MPVHQCTGWGRWCALAHIGRRNLKKLEKRIKEGKEKEKGEEKAGKEEGEVVFNHYFSPRAQKQFVRWQSTFVSHRFQAIKPSDDNSGGAFWRAERQSKKDPQQKKLCQMRKSRQRSIESWETLKFQRRQRCHLDQLDPPTNYCWQSIPRSTVWVLLVAILLLCIGSSHPWAGAFIRVSTEY